MRVFMMEIIMGNASDEWNSGSRSCDNDCLNYVLDYVL